MDSLLEKEIRQLPEGSPPALADRCGTELCTSGDCGRSKEKGTGTDGRSVYIEQLESLFYNNPVEFITWSNQRFSGTLALQMIEYADKRISYYQDNLPALYSAALSREESNNATGDLAVSTSE